MEKRWSRQEGGKSFGFNLLFSKMYVGLTLKIILSHSNLPIVMTQINKALGFNHLLMQVANQLHFYFCHKVVKYTLFRF